MISKKKKIALIVSSILFVIFAISGGYLLWRVTQPETVAPEDIDASACAGYTYNGQTGCTWISISSSTCCLTVPDYGMCHPSADCNADSCGPPGNCNFCINGSLGNNSMPGNCYVNVGQCWYTCSPPTTTTPAPTTTTPAPTTTTPAPTTTTPAPTTTTPTPTYTVNYDGGGGTCEPQKRENISHGGTATAPSCSRTGYTLTNFTRISGSGGNLNTNTGAVTNVTGTQTIMANWTINTYTVSYNPGENGTLEGDLEQTINYGGSTTPVTAVPNTGYLFGGWSDGKVDKTRTDTNVTGNINVTAIFSLSCGNGVCDPGENAQNCPVDCPADCGDGFCTHDENALNCPTDCPAVCGDGFCTHDETALNCPEDCPGNCGDGYCDPQTENASNCPADCPAICGDGFCTHNETPETCPEDCGDTPTIIQTGATVPETGIFDDTKTAVIVGTVLVVLGFSWIWLGRGMYGAISFLGQIPSKTVKSIKEMKENTIAKRKYHKMSERRKKFEKKVGKRI